MEDSSAPRASLDLEPIEARYVEGEPPFTPMYPKWRALKDIALLIAEVKALRAALAASSASPVCIDCALGKTPFIANGGPAHHGANGTIVPCSAAAPALPPDHDRLLTISGLVNGYHNDGTTLSAAETLRAIADVLGPALPPDKKENHAKSSVPSMSETDAPTARPGHRDVAAIERTREMLPVIPPASTPSTASSEVAALPPDKEPKPNVCAAHCINWCEVCMTDVAFLPRKRAAALPEGPQPDLRWQPIKTAPKATKGEPAKSFLVHTTRKNTYVVVQREGEGFMHFGGGHWPLSETDPPTHWMPLPAPPGASRSASETPQPDEIELRLDDKALAMLTMIVRDYRMKMQPGAPVNVLIDVVQEGLDRLMLQTIKGKRSALRGPLPASDPIPPALRTLLGELTERIRVDDDTRHDDSWPIATKGETRQLLAALLASSGSDTTGG